MKKGFLITTVAVLFFTAEIASGSCSPSLIQPDVSLFFYKHPIGTYTMDLTPTMSVIEDGHDHSGYPYFEKTWTGSCPAGLDGSSDTCIEFTVYPDGTNFTPGDIMSKIKKYTHGAPNRGEVRVITDSSETNYAYTTDHEHSYCGPYPVPTQSR